MAATKEYSGTDKKFMLQYPAGSRSQKPAGYIFKERFQVDVKVITDPSNFGQYPISTLYQGSRNIGELDGRYNTFVPTGLATRSQKEFFSNQGKQLVKDKAKRIVRDATASEEEAGGLSPQDAQLAAQVWTNSVFTTTSDYNTFGSSTAVIDDTNKDIGITPQARESVQRQVNRQFASSKHLSGTLRYPTNQTTDEYDYIQLQAVKWEPSISGLGGSSNTSGGTGSGALKANWNRHKSPVGPRIFLPMTPDIAESNAVDWGEDRMNPIQMAGAQVAAKAIGKIGESQSANQAMSAVKGLGSDIMNTAQNMMSGVNAKHIAAYFAGKAVNANVMGRAGIAINPNLEVLFNGPMLRTFQYNFRFTPRDDGESKTIRSIIKSVKKCMAPKRGDKGLFLGVPEVFQIKYVFKGGGDHPFLNKIKPCAMKSFNVGYAPDGSYMTYDDGSMTSYTISMTLAELEPVYDVDIETSGPTMGY